MQTSPNDQNSEIIQDRGLWAFHFFLVLLAPFLFLSLIFALLAPLPGLYLFVSNKKLPSGRSWVLGSGIFGFLLIALVEGPKVGLLFLSLCTLPSLVLGELFLRKRGPQIAVSLAFLSVVLSFSLAGGIYYATNSELDRQMEISKVEAFTKNLSSKLIQENKGDLPEQTLAELEKVQSQPLLLLYEFPGFALSLLALLCTFPAILMLRWNPKGFLVRSGVPRDFLRKWKSPEWLVWPSLLCGVFLIFDQPYVSVLAENLIKPILVIYFFHGLSILAFFLDSMRLRGPIRAIFYGAALMFLMPMVVSFGFFDLWFNFRERRFIREEKD